MNTEVLSADEAGVARALAILRRGGIVSFPTDTVYGLGCLAFDAAAADAIYVAKDRPRERALPILLAEEADLARVAVDVPSRARQICAAFWPGPLTIVLAKRADVPASVSPFDTIAVRIPDHQVARTLLRRAGPMAVTSANLADRLPAGSAAEVLNQLRGRIPLILDGGITPGTAPSTIVDCTTDSVKLLRAGPISLEQINAVIG